MLDPKIHTLLKVEELGSYTRAAQEKSPGGEAAAVGPRS